MLGTLYGPYLNLTVFAPATPDRDCLTSRIETDPAGAGTTP
jgi:hypothetical protein